MNYNFLSIIFLLFFVNQLHLIKTQLCSQNELNNKDCSESQTMISSNLQQVKQVFSPRWVQEGAGATVLRIIGNEQLKKLDPFLMLDFFQSRLPGGFPDHPHRGFETVTYMISGQVLHEDFLGNQGTLEAGDIQWMTPGKGIVHAQMPGSFDEDSVGFQLWVNLGSKDKMCNPEYQEIKKDKIPEISKDGTSIQLIAGEYGDAVGPIKARTPCIYVDISLQKNSQFEIEIQEGWNGLAFVYEGEAFFGPDKSQAQVHQAVLIDDSKEKIFLIETYDLDAKFILFAGTPLQEPVFQYGPFVMDTEQKLRNTFLDYQNGQNGFQNAHTWTSKIQDLPQSRQ